MRGWAAAILSLVVALVGLLGNPPDILVQFMGEQARPAFTAGLLFFASIALYIGIRIEEWTISRYVSIWSSGFAMIAVLAASLGVVSHETGKTNLSASKQGLQKQVKSSRKISKASYGALPDTPKFNKVERPVQADPENRLISDSKQKGIINKLSTKDARLEDDFQPSDAERKAFARFLKSQGLKYDPKTAFKREPRSDSQAVQQ